MANEESLIKAEVDGREDQVVWKRPHEEDDGTVGLMTKLRRLDSDICQEDYSTGEPVGEGPGGGNTWDRDGIMEDLVLSKRYVAQALEVTLKPLRAELNDLVANRPRTTGAVCIVPDHVYLGDNQAARDLASLQALGITRVINCSPQTVRTGCDYYGAGMLYMELWEDDLLDYCVMQDFDAVWAFASTSPGPCLVHCEQGVNRSGAMAMALHMKYRHEESEHKLAPEESFRTAWLDVAKRKGKVLTNPGFQRQLLLFAHLGCRWFPSANSLWKTSKERKMAQFRAMAERVARKVVASAASVPPEQKWRNIVFVRDGTMRGEMRMSEAFELTSPDVIARAERRIQSYALKSLAKHGGGSGTGNSDNQETLTT